MKRYSVKLTSQLLHSPIHQVILYFWVFIGNSFSLLCGILFLEKTIFLLVSLSLAYRWVNRPRYFCWTYCGVFLENYSYLLNNIVSVTWWTQFIWLIADDDFSWNNFYLIVVKYFWYGKKYWRLFGKFIWKLIFEYYCEC